MLDASKMCRGRAKFKKKSTTYAQVKGPKYQEIDKTQQPI